MKILLGHALPNKGPLALDRRQIEDWLRRLRTASIEVYPTPIGLDVPGRRMPWHELDRRWRRGDRELLTLYEKLAREAEDFDVLINAGAVNLHPEFLRQLSTINVLMFYDDPESSKDFSRPVALAHDLCVIGNLAEVANYKSWGVKNIRWCPVGFRADEYNPAMTEEDILTKPRDVDVTLLCERMTHWRRKKVDRIALTFPQGAYYGRGWPSGFLAEAERVPLLQRTRIGINVHNTTGPSNCRTYYLPANGILQICDQKPYFGQMFELGKEAIGFDSIDEAVELCRYYLEHEEERREIAAAGWRRAMSDYNEVSTFRSIMRAIDETCGNKKKKPARTEDLTITLRQYRDKTRGQRIAQLVGTPFSWPYYQGPRYLRGAYRRFLRLRDNLSLRLHQKF